MSTSYYTTHRMTDDEVRAAVQHMIDRDAARSTR